MFLFIFIVCTITTASNDWERFDLVRDAIETQPFFENICVSAGREENEFTFCKGNATMDTPYDLASSSKIVGAMGLYEAVEAGKARMDDHVSKYLDYWTDDESDTRGQLQLEHLVSFQSGYHGDASCEFDDGSNQTLSQCVRWIYDNVKHVAPGTTWDYNELHLQIVGAVLEVIYSAPIEVVLADRLKKYNMSSSVWQGGKNPTLAATLTSTGTDYEQFLLQYFNYNFTSPDFRGLMENNYNVYPEVPATPVSTILMLFVGHYGYTLWMECPINLSEWAPNMTPECMQQNVHSDPGLFGYWPVIDRAIGYWFQIVVQGEPVVACIDAMFTRLLIKPLLDAAMKLERPPETELRSTITDLVAQRDYWSHNETLLEGLRHMQGSLK